MIVTTIVGGDPDAALALAVIALTEPALTLVITAEESFDHRRARFAAHLLDLLGRSDVRVVPGRCRDSGRYRPPTSRHWAARGLTPGDIEVGGRDHCGAYDAVAQVYRDHPGETVRFFNAAPLTVLAHLLALDQVAVRPLRLRSSLEIQQGGGSFTDHPEARFRTDGAAARSVLLTVANMRLVLAETCSALPGLDSGGPMHRAFVESPHPWGRLMLAHLEQWWHISAPTANHLTDTIAATTALGCDFVEFRRTAFVVGDYGRLIAGIGDRRSPVSISLNIDRFSGWLLDIASRRDGGGSLAANAAVAQAG
ncbi:hypothetical protein ACWEKT_40335 [Nocardia takedensis]|uniref:hypothetical protein n=1 Tax=Nocardia takedensis TaxID=259390 RepID=UPI0012F68503|nr:hypothetical protein [Nocardia takedensis]